MSYTERLENFIIKLKGEDFFLSPRERIFLELLAEMGIPEDIVKEGIEKYYTALNPRKRSVKPVFLSFKEIMTSYERYIRLNAQIQKIDWRARFYRKLELVKELISIKVNPPSSEEEAWKTLKSVEEKILRLFWNKLTEEEKKEIINKYKEFKKNREIFREFIKSEIRKKFKIPNLSLYVD